MNSPKNKMEETERWLEEQTGSVGNVNWGINVDEFNLLCFYLEWEGDSNNRLIFTSEELDKLKNVIDKFYGEES